MTFSVSSSETQNQKLVASSDTLRKKYFDVTFSDLYGVKDHLDVPQDLTDFRNLEEFFVCFCLFTVRKQKLSANRLIYLLRETLLFIYSVSSSL